MLRPLTAAFIAAFCVSMTAVAAARSESGIASVYTVKSNRGTQTASGKPFQERALTAAHKKLAFGTRVKVTNTRNGRSVVVTITDRGPYIRGRIIDLTPAAGAAIGLGYSLAPVTVEVLGR